MDLAPPPPEIPAPPRTVKQPQSSREKFLLAAVFVLATILFVAKPSFILQTPMRLVHGALGGDASTRPATVVSLDEFVVNLADTDEDHYLKCTIGLELRPGVTEVTLRDKVPVIRDAAILVLSSRTVHSLRSSAGKENLKRELKARFNRQLGHGTIQDIYLEDFAVQ